MRRSPAGELPSAVGIYERPDLTPMRRAGALFLVACVALALLITLAFLRRYD